MSALANGNRALRDKNFESAITFYIQALVSTPNLAKIISSNIAIARKKYRQARTTIERKRVAVCGGVLSHQSADREEVPRRGLMR